MADLPESPCVASFFFSVFLFFFLLKMYDSETFRPWSQTWHVIPFRKAQRELSDDEEGKWNSSIVFFSTPTFDFNVLFRAFSWSLLYYGAKIICSDIVFEYLACIKALLNKKGYSYIDGGTQGKWIIKSSKKNRYDCIAYTKGCDHTSTNAPDPIRTPQLSVLGQE